MAQSSRKIQRLGEIIRDSIRFIHRAMFAAMLIWLLNKKWQVEIL
jgi:hypothetical protein